LNSYTGWNQTIAEAAYEKGYGVEIYAPNHIVRIQHPDSRQKVYLYSMHTPLNVESSAALANNKFNTNLILRDAGILVSRSIRLSKSDFLDTGISDIALKFPVVVKPNEHTVGGEGVILNIQDSDSLYAALTKSFEAVSFVIIEEYHPYANEYRVLVLDEKVIAVTQRIPAYIIGDGVATVEELIAQKNQQRLANPQIKMKPIPIDDVTLKHIQDAGYSLSSIIPKDTALTLQDVVNSGRGGEFYDMTDVICQENKDACIQAARALGLRFVGFDVLCHSIAEPIIEGAGIVVEANEYPGITCHIFPHKGTPRLVQYPILEALFI
jgi:cyanophycin synthetase